MHNKEIREPHLSSFMKGFMAALEYTDLLNRETFVEGAKVALGIRGQPTKQEMFDIIKEEYAALKLPPRPRKI